LDKARWSLRAITLALVLVPLLFFIVHFFLADDLLGLLVPPQLRALTSPAALGQGGDLSSTFVALGINPSGFEMPRFKDLTFDESTSTATLKLEITSPLTRQSITLNNLSFTVKNGTRSFTIELKDKVIVEANYTGTLSLSFSSSDPDALRRLVNIIKDVERPAYVEDLQLSDLYIDVNGILITVHDLGKISELFGGESP